MIPLSHSVRVFVFSTSVVTSNATKKENFNQFFYRKLKPSARPIEALDDPYRLVSAADCRLMAFETVHEATKIWVKGREFSVPRLLGDVYKDEVDKYVGGALAIFRLAPQDYHRFHSPVDGVIGKMTYISGEYYTVNVSFFSRLLLLIAHIYFLLATSDSDGVGCLWR